MARASGDLARAAVILNDLGKLRAAQQQYGKAVDVFAKSSSLARRSQLPALAGIASLNAGKASLQLGQTLEAKTWFDLALPLIRNLRASPP